MTNFLKSLILCPLAILFAAGKNVYENTIGKLNAEIDTETKILIACWSFAFLLLAGAGWAIGESSDKTTFTSSISAEGWSENERMCESPALTANSSNNDSSGALLSERARQSSPAGDNTANGLFGWQTLCLNGMLFIRDPQTGGVAKAYIDGTFWKLSKPIGCKE